MLADRIKQLRLQCGYSQAELARRLNVTRSSVNAWELGISIPTTQYIVEMAALFHVSSDYLLGIEASRRLDISALTEEEIRLVYDLLRYFDSHRGNPA